MSDFVCEKFVLSLHYEKFLNRDIKVGKLSHSYEFELIHVSNEELDLFERFGE